ncbi:MAG: hypothetical protein NTW48_10895 [Chloroflexi bacterium]|nr:hypothetical protein [Chloroflexota bacterium]
MSDTQKSSRDKIEQGLPRLKEGLPHQAFAIVGDKDDPETWKLPHHTKAIFRAIQGKIGHYRTTDWEHLSAAVAALSRGGFRGKRVDATEQQILDAAKHLARHYSENGKPVPDTLAALVE